MRSSTATIDEELAIMEWPGAAYLVAACTFLLIVAISAADLIHWLSTSYSLSDGTRILGLRYANYALAPTFAVASYLVGSTTWRAWPGLLLMFGVSYYAIANWRGYQVLPGTFDQIEFARMDGGTITLVTTSWVASIAVGLVFGFALSVWSRKPRDVQRLTYWSALLALIAVVSNYAMIALRPGMSMFAPTRHYAFTLLFLLAALIVGSALIWEKKYG